MHLKINNDKLPIYVANTMKKKIRGLLGLKKIDFGLLIPECNKIHTFGMQMNIDIIALDERNCVLFKYQNMSPNKMIVIEENIKKTSILELPANTSQKIYIGDILTFEFE
ncbi:MAG: hypothetical protein E7172_05355 [Firmicutes bacterium]|nr:hypothetical protein [Bacillota bacterium]